MAEDAARRAGCGAQPHNPERRRLDNQKAGTENWRRWGPYLAERAWGSVREDYSADGNAWGYFPHDHARSRAYRWSEDGLGGICDEGQHLCFALALWNGRDAILKERAFGLTGPQGNHGEDVKEYFFFPDATPSHSYLRFVYKYPQAAFPYDRLVSENARRGRDLPAFNLHRRRRLCRPAVLGRRGDLRQGVARRDPHPHHRDQPRAGGGDAASAAHRVVPQHLVVGRRRRQARHARYHRAGGCGWALRADHPDLGACYLYDAAPARLLFTENETNVQRLYGAANPTPWVKDAFHRCVVDGDEAAVNPAGSGTKVAGWHPATVAAGGSTHADPGAVRRTAGAALRHQRGSVRHPERRVRRLLRVADSDRHRRGQGDRPPGDVRHDLVQGVLPLRRRALAEGRPAAAAGQPLAGPQRRLAQLQGRRRPVDARHLGVSLVRRVGPGLPGGTAGPDRHRLRQGSGRAAAQRALHARRRRPAGLRMELRRRQSAGPRHGGAEDLPRRAGAARPGRPRLPPARLRTAGAELTSGGRPRRTSTAPTSTRAAFSASTTSPASTATPFLRAITSRRWMPPAGWRRSRWRWW